MSHELILSFTYWISIIINQRIHVDKCHDFNFFFFFCLRQSGLGCKLGIFIASRGLLVVAHRLSSCGAQAPERLGSIVCDTCALQLWPPCSAVAVHGLSCPAACGILVPRPGIEPASPALEGGFLTTGPPGKSPMFSNFN